MRTIVAGNNRLACDALDLLIHCGDIVGIVAEGKDATEKDEGWEKPFLPQAKEVAKERGLPLFVGNINRFASEIRILKPDLISFFRGTCLVKKKILGIPSKGATNLHYGALPRYGGCAPIFWALSNGECEIGITMHYMSESFDEGPIIDQRFISVAEPVREINIGNREIELRGLTAFEVYQEANILSLKIFAENYALISEDKERKESMDLSKRLYYRKGEDGLGIGEEVEIDMNRPIEAVSQDIRRLYFPPYRKLFAWVEGEKQEIRLNDQK